MCTEQVQYNQFQVSNRSRKDGIHNFSSCLANELVSHRKEPFPKKISGFYQTELISRKYTSHFYLREVLR